MDSRESMWMLWKHLKIISNYDMNGFRIRLEAFNKFYRTFRAL